MKVETQLSCTNCKPRAGERAAVCFRITGSRLEDMLGHRLYQCEKCGQQYKCTDSEEPWKTETPIMFGR